MVKCEEILEDYKRYEELLFKLSPPEWQEAHRTKDKKDKGNFKAPGISINTRTKNYLLHDAISPKEMFSTCVLSIITQHVLPGMDIKIASPGGQTHSMEDSSLSQTQRDTQ